MPEKSRPDVYRRLRSPDAAQFIGAYWEVFVHEMLRRDGYTLTAHPRVGQTERRPDFLAEGPNQTFYVEAKAMVGRPRGGASARKARLYDALDQTHSPDFLLKIDVNAVGPADLPARPLRRELEGWLASLDPDEMIRRGYQPDSTPRFTWSRHGWELELLPLPIQPERRGTPGHRPLAMFGPPVGTWVDDHLTLRDALADKGSAYGNLDRPLLLAVDSFAFGSDDSETVSALYGSEQVTYSIEHPERPAVLSRRADGYWLSGAWAHQHVSAVLVGRTIMPWSAVQAEVTMWTHPGAEAAITPLSCCRHARLEEDHIAYAEPDVSLATLFDLPAGWPQGSAFPR